MASRLKATSPNSPHLNAGIQPVDRTGWLIRWGPVGGLIVVLFIAYFRHFGSLGLYGDDPAFFGGLINRTWQSELENVWFCLSQWPQGRPLGMGLNLSLIPYLVFQAGGLVGLHGFAFLLVATNTTLCYRLLARYSTPLAAWSAAGFYALAPADTVQLSLVFGYNFEIAALFSLIAISAALRRWWILFSLALAACILMVEPLAMCVLVIPIFLGWSSFGNRLRWMAGHILGWTLVLGTVLLFRRLIGDPWGSERVTEIATQPLMTLQRGFESGLTGTKTHFLLLGQRFLQPWREADVTLWWVLIGCIAFLGISLRTLLISKPDTITFPKTEGDQNNIWVGLRLIAGGCASMFAAYLCYFRAPWYPANWSTGFMSGVHVVAAMGGGLVLAGIVSLLYSAFTDRFRYCAAILPLAVLTSFAGFGELVQRDYVKAWNFQKNFWHAYGRLCPDASEGTFVLVLDRNLPVSRFIELFSWCSETVPGALFQYRNLTLSAEADKPKVLINPPNVILTAPELVQAIRFDGKSYTWKPTYYFMLPKNSDQQPQTGNVIALCLDANGQWQRLEGPALVDGGTIHLRPSGGENLVQRAPRTPLTAIYGL